MRCNPLRRPVLPALLAGLLIQWFALPTTASSLFYARAMACGPNGCDYAPSQIAEAGSISAPSSISRGYAYVPPAGSSGGYNLTVSSAAVIEAPYRWAAYAQAGGYVIIEPPHALNPLHADTNAGASFYDSLTVPATAGWSGPGRIRFSWQVEGAVSVSYSAPGTPAQAGAGATLGFSCSYALPSATTSRPCESPDFEPPTSGSQSLNRAVTFTSSQAFENVFDFDVGIYSDQPFNLAMAAGVSAGLGMIAGTPVGMLNGIASADFQHTGRLAAVTVFDSNGNVVPDTAILSDSGFDYSHLPAVPAPPAAVLLLTALAGGAFRLRRACRNAAAAIPVRQARQ